MYFAAYCSASHIVPDIAAGNSLSDAKRLADETFGDLYHGDELQVHNGFAVVASRILPNGQWQGVR